MSSLYPVEKAVLVAYNTDAEWIALCGAGSMYSGEVPEEKALPYGSIGDTAERGTSVIKRAKAGFDNTRFIHLYSDEADKEKCSKMWEITLRLLNETNLPLDSGRMVLGTVELLSMLPDPSGSGMYAVVRYRAVTRI